MREEVPNSNSAELATPIACIYYVCTYVGTALAESESLDLFYYVPRYVLTGNSRSRDPLT